MILTIRRRQYELSGSVKLPLSKSESNRILIITALTEGKPPLPAISDADDTRILQELLNSRKKVLDCGAAGTTCRFLTAYLATRENLSVTLTGSDRMKDRPIGILVDALRNIGADISYIEKEGFLPLKINGRKLDGGKVSLDGTVSSQFVSALLLIAPVLKNGLEIEILGRPVSRPYVEMTLQLMAQAGIRGIKKKNVITIPSGSYQSVDFQVSPDWSAASYWYEAAAFSQQATLILKGLRFKSLQADEVIAGIFSNFGVESSVTKDGIMLKKTPNATISEEFEYDFKDCPDLVQTVAVSCAALGVKAHLKGAGSLRIKETDRLSALEKELKRLGVSTEVGKKSLKVIDQITEPILSKYVIDTYNDHRMAMAFAPLAMLKGEICIAQPAVVNKSYPGYWEEMKKFFLIHQKP